MRYMPSEYNLAPGFCSADRMHLFSRVYRPAWVVRLVSYGLCPVRNVRLAVGMLLRVGFVHLARDPWIQLVANAMQGSTATG